ncbi:MAG: tRNA (adenosine(37)-N6)-threonylcarbamoyltransferase complex ATPase subunit type 1 TsaE [Candidatus Bipolaricaulota bacterium]|nr:tRNA (adenosine(37)-N6)-threonylcarbamoyltransferase complex ATPase subunit type 1 TsaE [Candidatus Bipolaricaulota bacterium]MCS7274407.1 tRNA (adenosine(37)-N6)-threonylcarbamoyltransferase complex ATPase subunit type 1 TsaE [Candidatus Bipolaricaulota bacterium]MDW8110249.1 tRNA (adenosine(37)-N6)-threonylcarbamoyltransferase complex ATPase subunit type 1 TsaE [Candidatus Bipolaricaulota bacterium]MDW8328851.1 tRNA (adenosine(37)-N6)-threonylcarbamoyltransferase complex ATPase subunit type
MSDLSHTPSPAQRRECFISASADETRQIASRFAAQLQAGDCVLLMGELGAGKTTFVQGLAQALEVREPVRSPTFVLMHEYHGKFPIYHFDAYRIRNLDELREIGFEETVCSQGITVVEWGEKTEALVTFPCWRVEIELLPEQKRRIIIAAP